MLHRNGPSMQVVFKYFSCLLGNDVVEPGSRSRHSSDSSVAQSFVSCVQAGGGHFEHYF